MYVSVFVHRFRDVDYRIRTECVHELGLWMQKLPQMYFDGAHLRYMGSALSDSVSPLQHLKLIWRTFPLDLTSSNPYKNSINQMRLSIISVTSPNVFKLVLSKWPPLTQ